jgi:hypothetical protein
MNSFIGKYSTIPQNMGNLFTLKNVQVQGGARVCTAAYLKYVRIQIRSDNAADGYFSA